MVYTFSWDLISRDENIIREGKNFCGTNLLPDAKKFQMRLAREKFFLQRLIFYPRAWQIGCAIAQLEQSYAACARASACALCLVASRVEFFCL